MKTSITQLKESIADAKARHVEATKDLKKIEKDMSEFNNNKDSKLAELQKNLDKLKKTLAASNASIKPLHQSVREAMVEAEQCGGDLAAAQEQLQDAETTLNAQREEIDSLIANQRQTTVCISLNLTRSNTA
jgi:structural maintenance of chromosome 2